MYVHCDPSMEGTYELVCFVPSKKVVEQLRGCLLSTKPVDRHRHSDVELTISPLSATFSAGRLPATFQASDSSKLGWWFSRPKGASPQPNQHFGPKIPEISRQWGVQRHSFCGIDLNHRPAKFFSWTTWRPGILGPKSLGFGTAIRPKHSLKKLHFRYVIYVLLYYPGLESAMKTTQQCGSVVIVTLCLRTMAVRPHKVEV